jgi:hypothetical protein
LYFQPVFVTAMAGIAAPKKQRERTKKEQNELWHLCSLGPTAQRVLAKTQDIQLATSDVSEYNTYEYTS